MAQEKAKKVSKKGPHPVLVGNYEFHWTGDSTRYGYSWAYEGREVEALFKSWSQDQEFIKALQAAQIRMQLAAEPNKILVWLESRRKGVARLQRVRIIHKFKTLFEQSILKRVEQERAARKDVAVSIPAASTDIKAQVQAAPSPPLLDTETPEEFLARLQRELEDQQKAEESKKQAAAAQQTTLLGDKSEAKAEQDEAERKIRGSKRKTASMWEELEPPSIDEAEKEEIQKRIAAKHSKMVEGQDSEAVTGSVPLLPLELAINFKSDDGRAMFSVDEEEKEKTEAPLASSDQKDVSRGSDDAKKHDSDDEADQEYDNEATEGYGLLARPLKRRRG